VGLPVTKLAKWKTGFQMGALGTLLAGDTAAAALGLRVLPVSLIGELMLWTAAVLTMVTGWDYLQAGLRHAGAGDRPARPREPVRS
jgi:cardiolipin synthase